MKYNWRVGGEGAKQYLRALDVMFDFLHLIRHILVESGTVFTQTCLHLPGINYGNILCS